MIHGRRYRSNLTLAKASAELVDNSLDAGARLVRIIINKEMNVLTFSEDGVGCVDIEALMRMGKRVAFEGAIGRYGIGLKACAKVGLEPKYTPYSWRPNREDEWIVSQNIYRRALTPDQRTAIVVQARNWHNQRLMARDLQIACGGEGGRGHKKNPLG
jgi:hypothetical protein